MPVKVEGVNYFRTSEASRKAAISRSTLLRWIESGLLKDASRRDRRGWRLFSEKDIQSMQTEANRTRLGNH
jgi:DNA-binding transcriptional MerR regulator